MIMYTVAKANDSKAEIAITNIHETKILNQSVGYL